MNNLRKSLNNGYNLEELYFYDQEKRLIEKNRRRSNRASGNEPRGKVLEFKRPGSPNDTPQLPVGIKKAA
jgi:hypothetical protein